MKKTTIIIVLALLCSNFYANAQAVDLTTQGLQIGQQVPNLSLNNLHNYKDATGKVVTTAKFSDFKGKLVILDFWATWCSPCVAMIPKMDSLQRQFVDKIQFLSVTYETAKEVLPFLENWEKQHKMRPILPVITSDIDLKQVFPHRYLPHYVIIDGSGKVISITGYEEITAENIENLLGTATSLKRKVDLKVAYDPTKPLMINGNGGDGGNLRYHSLLTSYQPGLSIGYTFENIRSKDKPAKITLRNNTYQLLFALAYGGDHTYFGSNRVVNKVKDTTGRRYNGIGTPEDWINSNLFCYELVLPPKRGLDAFEVMRKDMEVLFNQYTAKVEKRKTKCLALQRTSTVDKIATKGGTRAIALTQFGFTLTNGRLNDLIVQLSIKSQQKSPYPLVNQTNYNGFVDMAISANLTDIKSINEALKAYDLEFVIAETEIEVLVIEDKI
ncbi:MAG: redoxin domain-containing protein [Chitinophagaceae bacterium]|nr:MAG: redoxin domain-containing protein [Chitinophagaceae bacterium]